METNNLRETTGLDGTSYHRDTVRITVELSDPRLKKVTPSSPFEWP